MNPSRFARPLVLVLCLSVIASRPVCAGGSRRGVRTSGRPGWQGRGVGTDLPGAGG